MRFTERYVVTRVRVTVTEPAWVCGCGEETYVRPIVNVRRHRAPVERRLITRAGLPLEGIVEMRHALAYIRDQAQRRSDIAMRDVARQVIADLQRCPRISILAADDSGRYIAVNDAACDLTGYSQDDLLDMSVWDLSPRRNVERGRRMWQHFLRDGGFDGAYHVRRKTGELIGIRCIAVAGLLPGMHVATMASRRAL